ncbi:MAG TPA: translation initiation factor IF-2 [bacterium]|nr:translation initiation factor IF-2 [bacterium]
MEVKTGVEEKRVKATVIRRRAKAESEAPAPATAAPGGVAEEKEEAKSAETAASSAPASEAPAKAAAPVTPSPSSGNEKLVAVVTQAAPRTAVTPRHPAAPGAAAESPEAAERERLLKKVATKKKSRDEIEMEMIDRAGGLKRAADLMESAPERLERVFRPEKSSKKKHKVLTRRDFKKTEITTPKAIKRVVKIEGNITVADLAKRMSIKSTDVVKKLIELGMMVTVNHAIDTDTATLVAHDFGYEVENVAFAEASVIDKPEKVEDEGEKMPRPPIVTVMGHVDHGKTSLLDAIRKTQVAAGEAGGITQHIGAYDVDTPKGRITFVDTPGHEAFTAMRARGAQVTDIVILVVAADDGIMPQTVEAINHAKAAKVPLIVAVNKIDKPEADQARVERGLMEHNLVSERLGGDTILAPVSAKTGKGIDELLEMILLQAEVLELKASETKRAVGTIIEARLDKGRGPVATVIVQEGTLRVGDIIVAGLASGKVRALVDALGRNVKEAGPSKPVEVLGLSSVPMAGDKLNVMTSEEDARLISEHREKKAREIRTQAPVLPTRLEDLYARSVKGGIPEVKVIVKGDVQGSVEALREAISKIKSEKVSISVIHTGVGAVTESDVMLAIASNAIVIGFSVRPDANARTLAEREKVQIRTYDIIYDVIEDMKKAMEGVLQPTYEERYLGRAEVRQTFSISKIGTIAGCFVNDGKILRTATVRLLRDGKVVTQGKISSLKRFKEDAKEVATGLECGIGIENYNDVKVGDVIEAFEVQEIATKL